MFSHANLRISSKKPPLSVGLLRITYTQGSDFANLSNFTTLQDPACRFHFAEASTNTICTLQENDRRKVADYVIVFPSIQNVLSNQRDRMLIFFLIHQFSADVFLKVSCRAVYLTSKRIRYQL